MIRNMERIQAAAIAVAAAEGWAHLTLAGVSRVAGLSIRPARDRYATRVRLACESWENIAGPALIEGLTRVLESAGLLDSDPDPLSFADSMERFARPEPALSAAAELAIVSLFEDDLRESLATSLLPTLDAWTNPAQRGPEQAARIAYLLITCLGLLSVAMRPELDAVELGPEWSRILTVLGVERGPVALPDEPRPSHLGFIPFATGDPTTDDLLRAVLDHIGRRGYEACNLRAVAAAAGFTEGAIYTRYPTKEAFVMDAYLKQQDIAMMAQREYLARLEKRYGVGIAEAVAIRGALHPAEHAVNVIEIERVRLSWHRGNLLLDEEARLAHLRASVLAQDPTNRDFIDPARLHLARAVGIGISFLPVLTAKAWDLPYDVVTIPLSET